MPDLFWLGRWYLWQRSIRSPDDGRGGPTHSALLATPSVINEGMRFASVLNSVRIVLPDVEAAEKAVVLGVPIPRGNSHIG